MVGYVDRTSYLAISLGERQVINPVMNWNSVAQQRMVVFMYQKMG